MKAEIIAPCARGKTETQLQSPFDQLLYLIHCIDNKALHDQFIRWVSMNIGMETTHRRVHGTELVRFSPEQRDQSMSKLIRHMLSEIGTNIAKSGQVEIIHKVDGPWFNLHAEFRYLKKALVE